MDPQSTSGAGGFKKSGGASGSSSGAGGAGAGGKAGKALPPMATDIDDISSFTQERNKIGNLLNNF